jgi:CzcA family heavy metal efflux pump
VTVVLFVFLFNLRTALISLTAIPLSILGAVAVLWAWGVSLNTLTLGGLAIAVGEVVDDAVIDVENIFRRLRENARLAAPRPAAAVVLAASLEVRSAVVYATFVVVLVFVPVFFLSGLQGRLFAPLGYAYVLAVLASLGVALTVTPALAMLLLPQASGASKLSLLRWLQRAHEWLLGQLQGGYEWLLRRLQGEFTLVLTVTLALLAASLWALWHFGGEFLPELRENHFVIHMRGVPGTSLHESLTAGGQISRALLENPAVVSVGQQVGRAELGEDTWGVEYSELETDLQLLAARDIAQTERELKETLEEFPGYSFEVLPFLTERIKETLSGTPAAVVVKVQGHDLGRLDDVAAAVAKELAAVKGSANVRIEPQTGAPELVVRIREEDPARRGLRKLQILDAVHTAYQGAEVGQVYDGNRIIDLVVVLAPEVRRDVDTVANLWLSVPRSEPPPAGQESKTPEGRLQLKQVADVYLSDGRFLIAHEGGTPRRLVTCNVKDRDVESFVAEAERRVRSLALPAGVHVVFSGEHEGKQTAQRELLLLSLAAGTGILLLLWLAFRSVRWLLLILISLLFAPVGGVAAVYLSGGVLNVGSLIGFVTLFGITMRNGIMMVSHWQHLHDVEGLPWGPALVFRGARERLAPVLMTALVTALGLLPIALGSGEAGREIEGPMALVILGGLVTSTALSLLVLPSFALRFGRPRRRDQPSAAAVGAADGRPF